jgi:hypothetical protein
MCTFSENVRISFLGGSGIGVLVTLCSAWRIPAVAVLCFYPEREWPRDMGHGVVPKNGLQ